MVSTLNSRTNMMIYMKCVIFVLTEKKRLTLADMAHQNVNQIDLRVITSQGKSNLKKQRYSKASRKRSEIKQ